VDGQGYIYVADSQNDRVHKFAPMRPVVQAAVAEVPPAAEGAVAVPEQVTAQ
jgi:hypothetical protein